MVRVTVYDVVEALGECCQRIVRDECPYDSTRYWCKNAEEFQPELCQLCWREFVERVQAQDVDAVLAVLDTMHVVCVDGKQTTHGQLAREGTRVIIKHVMPPMF